MNLKHISPRWKLVFLVFFLLLLINVLILDIRIFTKKEEAIVIKSPVKKLETELVTPNIQAETNVCPLTCLEAITEATATSLVQTTPVSIPVSTFVAPAVKEFYIPLGSGSTKSSTWVGLGGVESVIDMANYPNVKSIIFEASMRIPTANGKVYAKLFNVTDQHDVWFSEVSSEGSISSRIESKNINFAPGRKLYRVMMKSTMSYEALLDSARIKILLK